MKGVYKMNYEVMATNKEGIIRCIIVKTPDIKTFKGISVGQSANRITSSITEQSIQIN